MCPRGVYKILTLVVIAREGLFDEDILSGFEAGLGDGVVLVGVGGVYDQVGIEPEEIAVVGEGLAAGVFSLGACAAFWIELGDGGDVEERVHV